MKKQMVIGIIAMTALMTLGITAYADGSLTVSSAGVESIAVDFDGAESHKIYAAEYDGGVLKSVKVSENEPVIVSLGDEIKIFCWSDNMKPLAEPAKISARSVAVDTIEAYDNSANALTVKDGTLQLSENVRCFANEVSCETFTASDILDYIENNIQYLGESIVFTDVNADGEYDICAFDYYGTAVVDELTEGDTPKIYFADMSANIASRLSIGNEDTEYKFILDGDEITASDLNPYDVLTIKFNPFMPFTDSEYYITEVSRETVNGFITAVSGEGNVTYTIDGKTYAAALTLYETLTLKQPYTAYLDSFGRIAYAERDLKSVPIGILTNIYKKQGETTDEVLYCAELIDKTGKTVVYDISEDMADTYLENCLVCHSYLDWNDNGVVYGTEEIETRLYWYPRQVVTYYIDPETNLFELTSWTNGDTGKGAFEETYRASRGSVGLVPIDPDAVILDISGVDSGEEVKVMRRSELVDGGKYTLYGSLFESGTKFMFIVLTDTVSIPDTPVNPPGDDLPENSDNLTMAIFESSTEVEENGVTRTEWTVANGGEEYRYIVNDEIASETVAAYGDAFFIELDQNQEICRAEPIFAASNLLGISYSDFLAGAIVNLQEQLSNSRAYWNMLFGSETENVLIGVLVDREGNRVTLCEAIDDGKYINCDRGKTFYTSNTLIYGFSFADRQRPSYHIITDEGIFATPVLKSVVTENRLGESLLDITNDDIKDDVVFAVARVDDDEIKEIYLIYRD